MRVDPISVVEAAYQLQRSDGEWLAGILDGFRSEFDTTDGAIALLMEATQPFPAPPQISAVGQRDFSPRALERVPRALQAASSSMELAAQLAWGGPVSTLFKTAGELSADAFGGMDAIYVLAGDPSSLHCALAAASGEALELSRAQAFTWSRIAAHIAGAHRLRRRLGSDSAPIEAVLSPSGKVEYAEGVARSGKAQEALRYAAVQADTARGRARHRAPEVALGLWHALIAGRWTLVDQFERDGRRYLVARRNEPSTRPHAVMSEQERRVLLLAALGHSNKLIAYELGIPLSTVAARLKRALAKTGIKTRNQLVQFLAGTLPQVDQDGPADSGTTILT